MSDDMIADRTRVWVLREVVGRWPGSGRPVLVSVDDDVRDNERFLPDHPALPGVADDLKAGKRVVSLTDEEWDDVCRVLGTARYSVIPDTLPLFDAIRRQLDGQRGGG